MTQRNVKMVMVLLFFGLWSCSSKDQQVLGKWVEANPKGAEMSLEFFTDHTVSLAKSGGSLSGKWNLLEDQRVKGEIPAFGGNILLLGQFIGSELHIEMMGQGFIFNRNLTRL